VRIAVVDSYYPAFLAEHYRERPELARAPYAEQLDRLLDRSFGTFDAYTHHLRALGHDAGNVIANAQPLQARWSAEHDLPRRTRARIPGARLPPMAGLQARLLREVAHAQIEDAEAEVVYVHGLAGFPRADLDRLRAEGRLVAGQIASPLPAQEVVRGYDLILSSFPHYVERFRAMGISSEAFALGFDARLAERLDLDPRGERPHGAVFVGGLHPRWHTSGTALLERVAEAIDLRVWGYGAQALSAGSALRRRYQGEAWGLDMFRVLARARIVVNRHVDVAQGVANNMRLYEATGCGALLVTEAAPNLPEILEPGVECVTYRDAGELVERVRHYLAHDDERMTIAAAGQARTLRDHTYARRMAQLAAVISS
jgi:hypothetical protein